MAATQLYGSQLAAGWSIRSLEGLRSSLLRLRVSSAQWVEVNGKCMRTPAIRVSNINGRKLSVPMCLNRDSTRSTIEADTMIRYDEDKPVEADEPVKSNLDVEKIDGEMGTVIPTTRSAKIHDFCLGIPFGGFIFAGGLLGFIFSRNPTGIMSGGAILALSVFSLKVWRTGRSSLPFILGQAAIAAALLWKHLQVYSLSKKLFPAGLYIFVSAAMICFYSYVLISGGNPPPKKLAAAPPS
ncbi:protein FATTY ACID EXPORT 1, chloroplastic-like [Canna indica]|uniref:Protein FATTY ACID EXPORT 1, chloroplastic-like n=1 Tax=Canna indica TaxID=4628 RepID=A0AAQ3KCT8_9LILI|nr:protein FATTY ACID EXPORT 1, chloroplastic-like [Canna indica]